MQGVIVQRGLPVQNRQLSGRTRQFYQANVRQLVKRNVAELSKEQEQEVDDALEQQADLVALDIMEKMKYQLGRSNLVDELDQDDLYRGLAWSLREQLIDNYFQSQKYWSDKDVKHVYYLSAEFLMGRTLINAINNLDMAGEYSNALITRMGKSLEEVASAEQDAALGNGGLGRLAACFLDSMATLNLPAWGYGIRYKYGLFKQEIVDGHQEEVPDEWLDYGNPWELRRSDVVYEVNYKGIVAGQQEMELMELGLLQEEGEAMEQLSKAADDAASSETDKKGKPLTFHERMAAKRKKGVDISQAREWCADTVVYAMAVDMPIPGYHTTSTANLRLWDAFPEDEINLDKFNQAEFKDAFEAKRFADEITAVLYPNDSTQEGKELRLRQQYFFVSASLQDVIFRFKQTHEDWTDLPKKAAFQLNDTHPAIAVAEMMHLLVDDNEIPWEEAWKLTKQCMAYTNHTVLPEALERWDVEVVSKVLPRHMEIIDEIDRRWRKEAEAFWTEKGLGEEEVEAKVTAMAIVGPNQWNKEQQLVNMAFLSVVGSHAVNGVAAIHSDIIKADIFPDFVEMFPEKWQNKTNGVTPRRWLAYCNPDLSALITQTLGTGEWVKDTLLLKGLDKYADDEEFQGKWRAIKRANKERVAALIKEQSGDDVNLDALFDVHIKRIHEYKRQLMNILSVMWRYKQLKAMSPEERQKTVPRVVIMGGKAASAYYQAKRIIRLATAVGDVINKDPDTTDYLRLYFLENYNVSMAETLIPGAELSQHISTAGTEASGTSNMKFALNGSLIIGTMDGANVEIVDYVGKENVFIFGFTADKLNQYRKERQNLKTDKRWDELMEEILEGKWGDKEYFKELVDSVHNMEVGNDWFLVANDFAAYLECQEEVDRVYKDQKEWTRRSILYTANCGNFSSDRTIKQYADEIWDIKPCPVVPQEE